MSYGVERVVGALPYGGRAYWPGVLRRTYIEQTRLRQFMRGLINSHPLLALAAKEGRTQAVELGCGYGRMLPMLHEFADVVIGVERDDELRGIAALLGGSDETILGTPSLTGIPVESDSTHLVLTYTVLQHLNESECAAVLAEVRRILRPRGILICVEDNAGGGGPSADYFPRSIETYQKLASMELCGHWPRIVERNQEVGQMMAFIKE